MMVGDLVERVVTCPHCWEGHRLFIDVSAGSASYVEDCQVCCHPMEITLVIHGEEIEDVQVTSAL